MIHAPYLLFLGDVDNPLDAKTATGIAHWRPEICLGQLRLPGCRADTGLADLNPEAALRQGARTLIVGVAPAGGQLPERWLDVLEAVLAAGLDLASGLHARLADQPRLVAVARERGRQLLDVRHPRQAFPVGSGDPRPGKRILTVGTDTCVGKMFAALALTREMQARGLNATFRATGQTGIFIAGEGVCVDAVVADFIAGAIEWLCPANDPDHWDVIEGQGSLFHPGYAGVSLGLLHGAQPDWLVLCHQVGRSGLDGMEHWPVPSLEDCLALNLQTARLTNPGVQLLGVSLNTAGLTRVHAERELAGVSERLGVPCVDAVRTGMAALVQRLESA